MTGVGRGGISNTKGLITDSTPILTCGGLLGKDKTRGGGLSFAEVVPVRKGARDRLVIWFIRV